MMALLQKIPQLLDQVTGLGVRGCYCAWNFDTNMDLRIQMALRKFKQLEKLTIVVTPHGSGARKLLFENKEQQVDKLSVFFNKDSEIEEEEKRIYKVPDVELVIGNVE